MEITQKNVQIAKDILKIMNEQQCTVAEANDILAFVRNQIYTTTTVQAAISTNLSAISVNWSYCCGLMSDSFAAIKQVKTSAPTAILCV